MTDWIGHFRAAACGMKVSHVWRGYGSALFLELGNLTPRTRRDGSAGNPRGQVGIMIQWSWRIEEQQSIICGSFSNEELWLPAFDRLIGREVVDLSTFARLPEVLLSLTANLHVASFMTADGDPQWALFDRRSTKIVSLHCRSGLLCVDD